MKYLHRITHVRWRLTSSSSRSTSTLSSLFSIPWLHLSSLLLILLSYHQHTQAFCPSKCQCLGGDANSKAFCVNAELEDVPIQLNPETKYINLTLNKIRTIQFTLPFYMKLEILDLSRNIIETLGSKNFEYQTEMRTLNLSHNSVSSLQKDAFKGLSNLLVLDLSYNRIDIVDHTAMNDLTSLVELDLTNNNIMSLEDNTFRNLMSLDILIFKNNQLLDIPANNLRHLQSLKSLDLSDNLVEYIRNDSFEGLRELVTLTVRGNVISELDLSAFEGLITLKHMDIANNNLTMVPTQQLSKLSNLTHLTLSGNRFTHLPAVAFLNLFHLRELHLNRLDFLQRIDSRAFVDNTHLQVLHLNNNPLLNDLPMRLFQGNPNIVEVYMQANSLQTLYAAQFPIDQLEKLYLGDNPLQCNCTLFWLWRLVTGNFENGIQGQDMKPGNMMGHHDAGSVAALGSEPSGEGEDDNLIRVAAYVAERKKDVTAKFQNTNPSVASSSGYLKLDAERIGCEVWHDNKRTRKHLAAMTESEITCPAHVVTIVCAVLTCLLVVMTGASIIFYMRFVKRRRKLMHDRSLRSGKSIVNVHDRILPHQPLSAASNGGIAGTLMNGGYPHHTMQPQRTTLNHNMHPMHHQDYHQTLPQVDKLELERYLTAQAIANEYRALKPWELPPVKDSNTYTDEPEHLYEKFDHYDYPDAHSMSKSSNGKLMMGSTTLSSTGGGVGGGGGIGLHGYGGGGGGTGTMSSSGMSSMGVGSTSSVGGGTLNNKPHIVYV
ncbi:fish-lips isoform X1 [Musca autumnalis]|uniref:fish-lips isoform X1 n=1 Tax=Musca autumnalis TaxID=221902 RepID=UPI003CF91098